MTARKKTIKKPSFVITYVISLLIVSPFLIGVGKTEGRNIIAHGIMKGFLPERPYMCVIRPDVGFGVDRYHPLLFYKVI